MESRPLSCQITSDSKFCKNSDQIPTVRLPGAGLNIGFILALLRSPRYEIYLTRRGASILPASIYDQFEIMFI